MEISNAQSRPHFEGSWAFEMKAIILSAGQGSRLGHLVDDKPKCLIDFNGRSLLDRCLNRAEFAAFLQRFVDLAEGLRFDARPDFSIMAVFYGLIILVIAEVFRAGTRLDEEQSLTV